MELSVSTNQTLEYLECVLRFESSFMSDDISSEDYEYFFEVAREQGLDISEAYARFAKLQTQVRKINGLVFSFKDIESELEDTSQQSDLDQEIDEVNLPITDSNFKALLKEELVKKEKQIKKLQQKIEKVEEEKRRLEDICLRLLPALFHSLTQLVLQFWDFLTPQMQFSLEELAYKLYRNEVKGKEPDLKSGSYLAINAGKLNAYYVYSNFVDVIVVITGREDPEMLGLSMAEKKAIERLQYTDDESMWFELPPSNRSQPITPGEIEEHMKKRGYS